MARPNPANERIKHRYLKYLREAQGRNGATLDGVAHALDRFQAMTGRRDFGRFHREQAVAFKRKLSEECNDRTGERLSKATLHSTLKALRQFFIWLADQPGFRSKLSYSDADYFNLSDKDIAVARATRDEVIPTLDQLHAVLAAMPTSTDIERRDQAIIALAILTGARADALATVCLRHIDLERNRLLNEGRTMRTKASKTFPTWFMPVGGRAREIVGAWIGHLRETHGFSDGDPLFPATRIEVGAETRQFEVAGLSRQCWKGTAPIRAVFKLAFEKAGLPYSNPHSIRKTLVQLGERVCKGPEEFKAWSQNLGHSGVLTTYTSYGAVALDRQADIIRDLHAPAAGRSDDVIDQIRRLVANSAADASRK